MAAKETIVVDTSKRIGNVNPYLHGHFAEHLGELFYSGLYVGPNSDIPNDNGFRLDAIDALAELNIPILRWPGGCFADAYHWRDGIGPQQDRPSRINVFWGQAPEPNSVGTHEFMSFCRAIGAEPYFAGNVGSGTPAELSDWVEYCNFAGKSSLANERRANGEDDPFGIRFWGVGNENWGCGGHMTPQEYAALYSRYRTFMHAYSDTPVFAIACGPSDSHWSWTTGFFEQLDQHGKCRSCRVQGFAAHYYCGTAGTATEYTEKQWLELLARAKAVEGIIAGHRTLMDKHDPDRKIKLILDEWGAWHPVEPGKPDFGLYQQNTVRDAAVAALTLDIFNKNAEKLYMANIAQVANVLQSVLLIQGDHCIKTPTYHIFDLYQPHKGGTAVELTSSADIISYGEDSVEHCRSCYLTETNFLLRSVEGSATIKDGVLCITLVNTDPVNTRNIDMQVLGSEVGSAETKSLIARSIHDHNTFEDPEAVQLTITETIVPCDGRFEFSLPPASIIRLLTKATP